MALPEHNPDEKVKGGGWAPLIIIIAVVIGLLVCLKVFLDW